ncbi:MAG TPA: FecR family protein [Elusimicrobiota bacterium]|nr:FecR family protein [Elusimicrobiota bacterium]
MAESQARFGVFSGTVEILSQGAPEWVAVHEGLPIEPGDRIHTEEDSRAELIMSDNVLWLLRPDSEVVAEHTDLNSGRFDVAQGVLLGKVDPARAGAAQRWEINTPGAICTVRGAEFAVDVQADKNSRVGIFDGEVEVQPADTAAGESTPLRIAAPQEGVVRRGKPLQIVRSMDKAMQPYEREFADVRARLARLRRTWTPYTTTVRTEFRKKFIAPPPPPPKYHPVRPRRASAEDGGN